MKREVGFRQLSAASLGLTRRSHRQERERTARLYIGTARAVFGWGRGSGFRACMQGMIWLRRDDCLYIKRYGAENDCGLFMYAGFGTGRSSMAQRDW